MSKKKSSDWAEANKRCRLNQADIHMAKESGMTPKACWKTYLLLISRKVPVKVWIRDLYEKSLAGCYKLYV